MVGPESNKQHREAAEALKEVLDNFAFLDDWADRYRYLIDLGKKLEPFPEAQKVDVNLVKGCVSQVWVIADIDDKGTVRFQADSDAHIVRGLASLLTMMFSGRQPADVKDVDAKKMFEELDLAAHLSPSRTNGLFSMVSHMKTLAARLA